MIYLIRSRYDRRRKIKRNRTVENKIMEYIQETWVVEMTDEEMLNESNELCNEQALRITKLNEQIKKMKKNCLDVMRVQGSNLTDDYMAGMYNGMVVVYNSCFLKDDEIEKSYCSKNEYNKWELEE